ncbi:Protein NLP6 [Linum perenne]
MTELEDVEKSKQHHTLFITSPVTIGPSNGESSMELDLDLYTSSWPLDQISFASTHPTSPLFLPNSDYSPQPCSPLWSFSAAAADDDDEDNPPPYAADVLDYPLFLTCNPSSIDEKKKLPPPFPIHSSDGYSLIKERMTRALRYLKESATDQHILAQIWAPVRVGGGRFVLTTSEQPFVLDPHCNGLNQYRMVSLLYTFSVDDDDVEETDEAGDQLGLPGRVFHRRLPEWTPDVQYYSSKEYSRLDHALHYNVRGSLALPVFETDSGGKSSCVGVVELVMTSQVVNYAPEVDKVCKALEVVALQAVNLKSSQVLDHPKPQICNEGRQNALAEIQEILTLLCETHDLPLAQAWVPCMLGSILAHGGGLKKTCTSFDGNCSGRVCMSTTDRAFYVADSQVWGFREACIEHHLQAGQGVAGRAFLSRSACFCRDITNFCKTRYPLVHYARMFGLKGCFSICLKSSHTGDDVYVLEFFLNNFEGFEQKRVLGSLLETMQQHFRSLEVASGMEIQEEESGLFVEIVEASEGGKLDYSLERIRVVPRGSDSFALLSKEMEVTKFTSMSHLQQPTVELDTAIDNGSNCSNVRVEGNNCHENHAKTLPSKKKRGKTEISISLEVLQRHFAGSLKDASKSLGVCPTTMKRICRQHGISRWPSRKINKVNRSLTKLQKVIESVQVPPDASFRSTPLTTTSSQLPVDVSSIPWPSNHNEQLHIGINGFQDQIQNVGSSPESTTKSDNSTSHGSCEGSLAATNESDPAKDQVPSESGSPTREQEEKNVIIKARYKEDMIRFRIRTRCKMMELKEEVGKRLKLGVGVFEVKYLDDDNEWVTIVCDADLEECIDITSGNVVRMSIHEVGSCNLGSSCESRVWGCLLV